MTQRILFVLTSHDRKGPAGTANAAPSGFYLSEVTHPHAVLSTAGYTIDFVSPHGGKTHVDGLDLTDPVNSAFWNHPVRQRATEHTLAPAQVDPTDYAAIFTRVVMQPCGTSPATPNLPLLQHAFMNKAVLLLPFATGPPDW